LASVLVGSKNSLFCLKTSLAQCFEHLFIFLKIVEMKIFTVIAAALVLGTVTANAVKILTTENFEHDTQAATGQTTGVWCVDLRDTSQLHYLLDRGKNVLRSDST
jgi:hypothetical protein